ncbi:hypothetical protein RHRU231_680015 [Rhodococcus ruber]|uniref:Uncharacterized protein n=1 Tax=Rhodococcus ruber TaxID=1830 RepID=A0A098BR97_9NOCA|nr:hypothetical protein RHRU231_680015 [Rhodococcus ruber]
MGCHGVRYVVRVPVGADVVGCARRHRRVCYWPLVYALRSAWGPPLITVATIGTTAFTIWRGARPAAAGFPPLCRNPCHLRLHTRTQ